MERGMARPKRAMGPLDEAARARLWGDASAGCASRESEQSAELEDLVFDSFFYADEEGAEGEEDLAARRSWRESGTGERRDDSGGFGFWSEREMLEALVSMGRRDQLCGRIKAEVEAAWRAVGADQKMEEGMKGARKRCLVWRLREKGFDAGLCKCLCEKEARFPAVAHEFVDVIVDGGAARYIVEPNLASEFEIARPTARYQELLHALPPVFVGRPEALRDVVGVMCAAAAESMKSREMHLPPWRKREYVQGKWLGPHKRTTSQKPNGDITPPPTAQQTRSRIRPLPAAKGCNQSMYTCRVDFGCGEGMRGRKVAVGL